MRRTEVQGTRRSVQFAVMVLCLVLVRCAAAPDTPTSTEAAPSPGVTADGLIDALRQAGLHVEDAGVVEQPFFPVPARVFVVDGDDLQLYEFAEVANAEAAAAQVGPGGSTIGTSSMTWLAPPHFFRKGRLIVNYLGSSPRTLDELRRLLGPQFAGQ